MQRSANVEAITHLTTALELLKTLPDTPERAQQELTLHITLACRYMAPEALLPRKWKQPMPAPESCASRSGRPGSSSRSSLGCGRFIRCGASFSAAQELGEQLLGLAQREQDPALLMVAYRALGSTLFHLGEFSAARAHLEQSLTLYDAQHHHSICSSMG